MRKILLTVLMLLSINIMKAQIIRDGNDFKVVKATRELKSNTKTIYTWTDKDGNIFPIFITNRGACYILKTSKKTGKEYKYYLPKEIQETIKKELSGETK